MYFDVLWGFPKMEVARNVTHFDRIVHYKPCSVFGDPAMETPRFGTAPRDTQGCCDASGFGDLVFNDSTKLWLERKETYPPVLQHSYDVSGFHVIYI